MKSKKLGFILLTAILILSANNLFADNPIIQTIYTADPAPMVHDGTVYLYTTHDEDTLVNDFFTMNDWRCYSSTDMVNWTDHGSPLSYKSFSWAKGNAWAAQCAYRNGKFYLYVPLTQNNGSGAIGVAVSTTPEGPFTDPLGSPLVSTGTGDIDPTVYIDDDGQAYLYWGNPNLWWVKLNEDMISYSGRPAQIPLTTQSFGVRTKDDRPTQYEEGPWFYKRNNTYYMVFAAGPISEHISYSTSPGPTGPWTFGGIVMPTQGSSFTNHPGVIDYKDNSYLFYHNGALTGGGGFHRSVCIEQFSYNSDGSIPTINMTTGGVSQLGTLNPYETVEAETICWESGIETETCSEGGMNVGFIENGDWIKVEGVNFGDGATSFEARVASANDGGNIELRLGSSTGTLIGTCAVPGTGGWQNWVTESCSISGASGIHDLYLKFTGSSGNLFNVNWWKFDGTPAATPTPTPVPTPTPTPNQEPIWSGGPYILENDDFIDLPDGITGTLGDFTIACWVKLNSLDNWSRIFDMGEDSNVYMMLTPASSITGYPYFCITLSGNSGEQGVNGTSAFPTGSWQHIAVVKNGSTCVLYINSQETGSNTEMTLNPSHMGNTTNNYIGKSQWPSDPYLNGDIDNFYIYNRALSSSEISALGKTPPGEGGIPGDTNDDENVDIVDALRIAQYYVGLEPSAFVEDNADVNCDGTINIIDALLVAQYYVGLIQDFQC